MLNASMTAKFISRFEKLVQKPADASINLDQDSAQSHKSEGRVKVHPQQSLQNAQEIVNLDDSNEEEVS